jgi:hypothetical protein
MGQAKISSGVNSPLGGDYLSYYQNTTYERNKNLIYEPIPYEYLRTYNEAPQVEVSINGTKAVCGYLNCDYQYIAPIGEVTSFTYDGETR